MFGIAVGFNYFIRVAPQTKSYVAQINHHLHKLEHEVLQVFDDPEFLIRQIENSGNESEVTEKDFNRLKMLADRPFTIAAFSNDSLLFWTNNFAFPETAHLSGASGKRTSKFIKTNNGFYELVLQRMEGGTSEGLIVSALIPIKYQYSLESDYLKNEFVAGKNIPHEFQLSDRISPFSITTSKGGHLCYLLDEKGYISTVQLKIGLWLYFLAFIVLIVFFSDISRQMIRGGHVWQGAAFLIVSIFGVRGISLFFNFSANFSALPLFNQEVETNISTTLGDLLINIVLLLWVMAFFHKETQVRSYDHLSKRVKFGLTTLNYLAILAAIFTLTGVLKALVFNTNLTFDFENVFTLDSQNLFAVTGIILLLIALFLFSHRMMLTIEKIGLSRYRRLIALAIATTVCVPVFFAVDFIISPAYLLLIAFVFILIFDLFIDSGVTNFTWLIIWLVILSAFPSILLFRYNSYFDRMTRVAYAKELADTKDLIAENAIAELKKNIENNDHIREAVPPFPFKVEKEALHDAIDKYYSGQSYLYYNYNYTVYGFDRYGNPVIEGQVKDKKSFDKALASSQPTTNQQLKYRAGDEEQSAYLTQLNIQPDENPQNNLTIGIEFQRKRRDQSKVYTELLIDKPYKNLKHLAKYDYAIYKNNRRVDSEGTVYGNVLSVEELPEKGERKEVMAGNRSELIYHSEDGGVVIIGRQTENYTKKAISLFSYIFSLFFAFIVIFAAINTSAKFLPESLKFYLLTKPSLKNKIQLSVIGLIIASFFFIGFVTIWFFKSTSNEYHENRLKVKTSSIKTDALHDLSLIAGNNQTGLDLEKLNLVEPLSKIHRIDVNLFDLSGKLVSSSEVDIFNKGIVAPQMGALPFYMLNNQKLPEYIQENERIGKLAYKSAYIPLNVNNKTIAYLGLPYYSEQSKLKNDVTLFMSTLLNVYVFLLLIASGLAIAVANSITNPIAIIGEKLKQFKLGGRNEMLEWKSQDELGVLISEYNLMIKKLDESAEKLAQSEREGAWREMAKQVAHEIKNPLTPMKLSIQYLLHAFHSNPDNVEPLLKRVTSTLIEQIENLSQISTEFSTFAKMPRAENQKINLNDLVYSVYDLFSKGQEMDISIDLPDESFFVFADKNQLMRVLTNLMKNAEQAIPEGRKGSVDVLLYEKNDCAIIKVSDNGTGIPDDKKDKVFVPNFTTKSSGTGLGLAISKNIIESVRGKIYFQTREGAGTDFFIELPIVDVRSYEEAKVNV
jgi:two-component system, NtrC family, nitrogen regulation sensor histidine kinase NtrY